MNNIKYIIFIYGKLLAAHKISTVTNFIITTVLMYESRITFFSFDQQPPNGEQYKIYYIYIWYNNNIFVKSNRISLGIYYLHKVDNQIAQPTFIL